MAEADDELDIRRELDTRDSLASMAHYHASSPSAITAQVFAAKLHSHCDRVVFRPVPVHFLQSSRTSRKSSRSLAVPFRSVRSLAAGSLRKSQDSNADGNDDDNGNNGITPRMASSALHYVD